jgi:hypothetical protein
VASGDVVEFLDLPRLEHDIADLKPARQLHELTLKLTTVLLDDEHDAAVLGSIVRSATERLHPRGNGAHAHRGPQPVGAVCGWSARGLRREYGPTPPLLLESGDVVVLGVPTRRMTPSHIERRAGIMRVRACVTGRESADHARP